MNCHNFICLAGIATFSTLIGLGTPAQAFSFGANGIKFDGKTKVNFSFINSQGAYTSSVKIVEDLGSGQYKDVGKTLFAETRSSDNGGANDWLGTCGTGKTVLNCQASFTFQKGVRYSLLLDSGNNGRVFSSNALNTAFAQSQQAKFFDNADTFPTQTAQFDLKSYLRTQPGQDNVDPFSAPVLIAFDDRGAGNDKDFNDFKFTAHAEQVPEPTTLVGLGLVTGILAVRRRAVQKTA